MGKNEHFIFLPLEGFTLKVTKIGKDYLLWIKERQDKRNNNTKSFLLDEFVTRRCSEFFSLAAVLPYHIL